MISKPIEDNVVLLIPNTRILSEEFSERARDYERIIIVDDNENVYYNLLMKLKERYEDYNGFVYFLEDDDLLSKSFPHRINLEDEYDGLVGNYLQARSMEIEKDYKHRLVSSIDKENFQLGRCIFRFSDKIIELFRDIVPCDHLKMGCVHNDYFIFEKLNLKKTNQFFFIQGSHGDNVSCRMERNVCKGCVYNKGF